MAQTSFKRIKKVSRWLVFIGVIALVGGWFAWRRLAAAEKQDGNARLTVPVRRGQLVISVTEAGTIKPQEQTVIKSQLEGRSTILYLIPEGESVKEGELLVELDATSLVDQRVDQEIRVQNMESQFIQARENMEVVKNQATADLDKAELAVRFAREDLKKYKEGEYPNQLKNLQSKITLAEEEVNRTREKLEWSQQLYEEKYLSETELKADELAYNKARLDLELARSNLQLLEEYTYKRNIDQLTSDLKQAEMALERVRRKAAADLVQAEAQLRAKESEFNRQKEKLVKIDEQIVKAKVYAPTDGSVVYATSTQFSWRGNVEPLDEGQEVRERQELIHLPVAGTFMAVVKVHESSLKKIYAGLPVQITVDAVPGRAFRGKVSRIAPLPDPQSTFMNPDLKLYTTDIEIEGGGDVLRTGMTCEAEIVVNKYEDALYLPVQCVVREGGQPTVYVENGDGVVPKQVEIGLDNNTMVHIVSGLEEGEEVLLAPPLSGSNVAEPPPDVDAEAIPERPGRDTGGGGGEGAAQARTPRGGPRGGEAEQTAGEQSAADPGNSEEGTPAEAEKPRGERRQLTAEQRQQMRERMQNMTEEQRQTYRRQMQGQRRQQTGDE